MVNPTLFAMIKNEIPYKIQAIKAVKKPTTKTFFVLGEPKFSLLNAHTSSNQILVCFRDFLPRSFPTVLINVAMPFGT